MNDDQREFLNLRTKPGASGFLESSHVTGLHVDGLIYLEKDGHFKAMANPPPGAQRYFLTSYVMKIAQDEKWMTKAVKLIRENSRRRNQAGKKASIQKGASHGQKTNGFSTRA